MEKTQKISAFSHSLIWFGAAVSIAEILTGTFFAPLGFAKGMAAIVTGHIIGGLLMYFAGLIGANTGKSSMETVKLSFGEKGSLLFSGLNVLQLVGWTAIMIISGAAAAQALADIGGQWLWSIIIGALVIVWVLVGIKNLDKLNIIAMLALLVLTFILSLTVFRGDGSLAQENSLSFGAAVELSVAMPLSWLPLVSDYTRYAKEKRKVTFAGVGVYGLTSCWMYAIGLGAAYFTGESDISLILLKAGLGVAGLIIVIFSTVTTTFLDVFSAGVSLVSVSKKVSEKWAGVTVGVLGTVLAIFAPMESFTEFLYLIGSVFAPMVAILITDHFILKKDCSQESVSVQNLALWAVGFAIYRLFMGIDIPLGSTAPVMVIISVLDIVISKVFGGKKDAG